MRKQQSDISVSIAFDSFYTPDLHIGYQWLQVPYNPPSLDSQNSGIEYLPIGSHPKGLESNPTW